MKQLYRILSLALALCLLLSVCAFAGSGEASGAPSGDMTPPGGVIKDSPPDVEALVKTSGNQNKELTMFASDYSTTNTFVGRDDTGYIYIGYDIVDGKLTDQSNWQTDDTKNIVFDQQVTGSAFSGLRLAGEESDVSVTGNLMLTDAQSDNDGSHASDFSGVGAAITAVNGADIVAEDLNIVTYGFVRAGLILDNNCTAWLKGCTMRTFGNDPFTKAWDGYENSANTGIMLSPPWVLGIQGGVRTINVLDSTCTLIVEDSYLASGGWGVLSTDGCYNPAIYVIDSELEIMADGYGMDDGAALYGYEDGRFGSGYGAYIIGGTEEHVYGSDIHGATYAAIAREGSIDLQSSTGEIEISNAATGASMGTVKGDGKVTTIDTVFGFMTHAASDVWITVQDGTIVNTAEATFLYRDTGHAYFTVDNAELNPENGILLQMMDTDDSTVGGFNPFNEFLYEDAGVPSESGNVTGESASNEMVIMTLTNGEYTGDLYNGTGYYTQAGDVLDLTIGEGATLDGDVILSETFHGMPYSEEAVAALDSYGEDVSYVLMDGDFKLTDNAKKAEYIQFTQFSVRQYFMLCRVLNKAYYNGQSAINVYVQDGGVWNVTGESLVTYLKIDGGTVYGELSENADGSLTLKPGKKAIAEGEYGIYVEANVAESTGMGMVGGGASGEASGETSDEAAETPKTGADQVVNGIRLGDLDMSQYSFDELVAMGFDMTPPTD